MLPRCFAAAAAARRAAAVGRSAAAAAAAAEQQQQQEQRLLWVRAGAPAYFSTASGGSQGAPLSAAARDTSSSSSKSSSGSSSSSSSKGPRRYLKPVAWAAGAIGAAGLSWALLQQEAQQKIPGALDAAAFNSSSSSSSRKEEGTSLDGWRQMKDELFDRTDDIVVLFLGGPQDAEAHGPLIEKLRGLVLAAIQQQKLPASLSLFYAFR